MSPSLPDDARLWVFTAAAPLDDATRRALTDRTAAFLAQWDSHGRPVPGEAAVQHDRFLIVAAHLAGGVSGCGIDSLVHAVEDAGAQLGVEWVDGLHLAYRDDTGAIQVVPRPTFRGLVGEGVITAGTPVFVTTLDTLGALRAGGLEQAAGEAWHGRVFRIPAAV